MSIQRVVVGPQALEGDLALPERRRGLVVFAQGSGMARRSPRNHRIAQSLHRQGFATLLFDLLAPTEAMNRGTAFDVALLSRRLGEAIDWIDRRPALAALPLGLLGVGNGVAAALSLSAERPGRVEAVVSRNGRPDLAGRALSEVKAPTLLIVGAEDADGLVQNRLALARIPGEVKLRVIGRATESFDEPQPLARAAGFVTKWFASHMPEAMQRLRA